MYGPSLWILDTSLVRRLLPAAVAGAVLLAACGDDGDGDRDAGPAATPEPAGESTALAASEDAAPLAEAALPDGVKPVEFESVTVPLQTRDGRSLTLLLEVADTFERRTRGLMFRTALPPASGMVFAFPEETLGPFWAKDTPLSLDIAFLDEEGRIQSILRLERLSTELIAPEEPYLYAVEMAAGWFAEQAAGPGDRFLLSSTVVGMPD